MKKYNPVPIDEEERQLMDSLNKVDVRKLERPTKKQQHQFQAAARRYVRAEAKMNIRIEESELNLIKERAEKEGLKYQTLVKSVLHKYITGQLVERKP